MTDQPPIPSTTSEGATHPAEAVSESMATIGPYRVLQCIGEGAMGQVWRAAQISPVRRQVALKLLKAGMDTAHVIARFEAERQALAVMDHPAIAKVFDAGVTPEGRPYFAMEYVTGEPITTYCNRHRLPTRERLDLFLKVCDGVHHAHQKGVIHRDLKPSNILVTLLDGRPVPKIIDFGVAKAIAQPLVDRPLYTEVGTLIGTPEYMSPEQAEMTGLDIDTRTDVYALGVVLYELLTGMLPFDSKTLRQQNLDEIRRTIREVEPPRPSTRVTRMDDTQTSVGQRSGIASLAGELRGDLDWITMKALEKDRTRRYSTASQLADDIERYLSSQPVMAGPPSARYRIQKFVARNRGPVIAAAVVLLALVAGLAASSVLYFRAERERQRADTQMRVAKRVSEFLTGLFEVSDPTEAKGREVTARELLDKGATSISGMKDQPVAQATLMDTMGHVYYTLGLYDQAANLLESAVRIRRQQLGPNSLDLALSTFNLAAVRVERGDSQEAERLAREALRIREQQLPPNDPDLARAVHLLGVAMQEAQRIDEAERYYKRAAEIMRQAPGDNEVDLAGIQNDLATLYQEKADYPKALELYQESVRVRRKRLGDADPTTVQVIVNMAGTLQLAGRYDEAAPLYKEGLARQRQVYGNEHPLVATTVGNLALVEHELHNDAESERLFREAIAIQRKTVGENSLGVAISTSGLAKALQGQKQYAEAERLFRHAIDIERSSLGEQHPAYGIDSSNLAELLMDLKRYAEAEPLLLTAERVLIASSGENHPRVAKTRRRLVRLYRETGRPELAAKYEKT